MVLTGGPNTQTRFEGSGPSGDHPPPPPHPPVLRAGMGRLLDGDKNSVTHEDNPKWGQKVEVPVNRLDDLVQEKPWILKIDVEGAAP